MPRRTSLSACIATLAQQGSLPESLLPTLETSLFSLQNSLSSLTRTSTSPPPQTGTLQTRLSVYAYLLFLPFQLNQQLGWFAIPAEAIVALVYLGFMAVGADIGRPFKSGLTKLDLGGLVDDLKRQIEEIAQTQVSCLALFQRTLQLTKVGGSRESSSDCGSAARGSKHASPGAIWGHCRDSRRSP